MKPDWEPEEKLDAEQYLMRMAASVGDHLQVVVLSYSVDGVVACRMFNCPPFGEVSAIGLLEHQRNALLQYTYDMMKKAPDRTEITKIEDIPEDDDADD